MTTLRTQSAIVLCMLATACQAQWIEIGVWGGRVFPQGDFGRYWEGSPCVGLSIALPFHARLPAMLSATVSRHLVDKTAAPRPGHRLAEKRVGLLTTRLGTRYAWFPRWPVSPTVSFGVNTSTFVQYSKLPPPEDSDETEIGASAGLGAVSGFSEQLTIALDYRQSVVLTQPRAVTYGTAVAGASWRFYLTRRTE